jgi:hypothetical protein
MTCERVRRRNGVAAGESPLAGGGRGRVERTPAVDGPIWSVTAPLFFPVAWTDTRGERPQSCREGRSSASRGRSGTTASSGLSRVDPEEDRARPGRRPQACLEDPPMRAKADVHNGVTTRSVQNRTLRGHAPDGGFVAGNSATTSICPTMALLKAGRSSAGIQYSRWARPPASCTR